MHKKMLKGVYRCVLVERNKTSFNLEFNSVFELTYSLLEHLCREADERRQMMLSQILSSQARERSKSHLNVLEFIYLLFLVYS